MNTCDIDGTDTMRFKKRRNAIQFLQEKKTMELKTNVHENSVSSFLYQLLIGSFSCLGCLPALVVLLN